MSGTQIDTGTDTVLAEVIDGVGVVTLNRPERRNALNPEVFDGVPRALDRLLVADEVGCIMITGAGTAFCSGGDVRAGRAPRVPGESRPEPPPVEVAGRRLTHDTRMVAMLHASPKLTIAAINGAAAGAGIGIALAADLRIAARSMTMVAAWSALGFSGDYGAAWFLQRRIGTARTLEFLLENRPLDAETCRALGLVNRVVDDDALRSEAMAWARSLAAGPRTMQSFVKENLRQAEYLDLAEYLPLEAERMSRSARTDEHRTLIKAWLTRAAEPK